MEEEGGRKEGRRKEGKTEDVLELFNPDPQVLLALSYFKAISIDTNDFKAMDPSALKPYYDHFSAHLSQEITSKFLWILLIIFAAS